MSAQIRKNPFMAALAACEPVRALASGPQRPAIYVAGPITGRDRRNLPAFREAKRKLTAAGFDVVLPHDIVGASTPWLDAMLCTLAALPGVQGVAALDGWQNSTGASIEIAAAEHEGIPAASVDEWVEYARREGKRWAHRSTSSR